MLLLRNDWRSVGNGALLWVSSAVEARFLDPALPAALPGGAEVVRRMASREPTEDPMIKAKPHRKPKRANLAAKSVRKAKTPPERSTTRSTKRDGARKPVRVARANTKQADVLALLSSPSGTTIEKMMKATGWQPHSVRGFLAGVVRKKLKLDLISELTELGRVYRLKSDAANSAAATKAKSAKAAA
jgi:uncharacterized protein DUF3489